MARHEVVRPAIATFLAQPGGGIRSTTPRTGEVLSGGAFPGTNLEDDSTIGPIGRLVFSKKSPTVGPTDRIPYVQPEYPNSSIATYLIRGPLGWIWSHAIFDGVLYKVWIHSKMEHGTQFDRMKWCHYYLPQLSASCDWTVKENNLTFSTWCLYLESSFSHWIDKISFLEYSHRSKICPFFLWRVFHLKGGT